MNGYTDAEIFRDPRARLLKLLSDNSMETKHGSGYLQEAMRTLRPLKNDREWVSTIRLDHAEEF
jgi:hypothetical protein